jgi:hypothetical protein
MGIGIKSIQYQTQSRGAVNLDILQACIGEQIKVITELYFDEVYICDDVNDRTVQFVPTPDLSGILYNNDLIYFSDGDLLNNSQVGDIFITTDPSNTGTFKLLEKLADGTIGRFDRTFNPSTLTTSDQYVANITDLKSLIYQYGINESGEFTSQIDGSIQEFSADSSGPLASTSLALSALGNLDWQIDSVQLIGTGYDPNFPSNIRATITLTHTVTVTPLYLAGQYDNMRLGIPPDYFKPDNTIKYNALIEWNKSSSYLDPSKTISLPATGQFGWFGTKYNGSKSDYSISSFTIQRVSDSEFINQLEYDEVEVKFIVTTTGAVDPVGTSFIFGFNYLPEDESIYQDTNRSLSTNFCFDSQRFNPNNTPVNGAFYGTSKQIIKTVNGQVLTSSTAQITVRILFGSDRVNILKQEDVAHYAMWIISERTTLDVEICDKSNLLIQVDQIHEQLISVNLLTDVTTFLEHPYNLVANGFDTLQMFPVDDVVANSLFALDYTGLEDDGILLKSCTPSLVITHASEADITLDSVRINLDNFPTIGTLPAVQAIDFNQLRPYKIEDGIRKSISLERDYNADSGETKYFALNFPFMNRWEYWLQIAGITSIPSTLFDPSVPFNGANHLWNRLANSSGWTLKYRVVFEILQNGQLFEQEFEHDLTSTYFESNTDWNNCTIKTYDPDTNDEIIVGSKKYAYGSGDTKVVCSFEKTVGTVPDNVAIVIWAEGFEGGGITEITRISSQFDVTSTSLFKSIDGNNRVVINKTGDVFTGTALLNGDKLKNLSKLTLYARIYELQDILDHARITNDFILRYTNDGQVRLVLS